MSRKHQNAPVRDENGDGSLKKSMETTGFQMVGIKGSNAVIPTKWVSNETIKMPTK